MAKILFGPMIQMPMQSPTGSWSTPNTGLFLNNSLTSTGIPESWTPNSYPGSISGTVSTPKYNMLYTGSAAGSSNKYLAGGPAGSTKLLIFSGSRPAIATISNLSNYNSNLLISFSIPAYSTDKSVSGLVTTPITDSTNTKLNTATPYTGATATLGISPAFVAASATGRATWFWFGNYTTPSDLSGKSFVTGSIGIIGSGSDMEMANPDIASGDLYKSLGFKFHIPTVHTIM